MDNAEFQLFPDAASTVASRVDALFLFMTALTVFFTVAIAGAILYLGIRYRRGANVNRSQYSPPLWLELSWLLTPVPVVIFVFIWSSQLFLEMQRPPKDAMEIRVVAKQWMWKLQHPSGRREIDELHVPTGRAVRMTMISEDVIHSFYVPAFRIKQDVLPGRYTTTWFEADTPGTYHLFCAEYCGTNHSRMKGRVVVQTPSEYEEWLGGGRRDQSPVVAGAALYEQFRCGSCHAPTVTPLRAPPLEGIYGRSVKLANGATVTADDSYLRESITRPAAKVVAGFQPIMPVFEGQISEEGLSDLLAYLKSLGAADSGAGGATEGGSGEGAKP
ncbi:cytochrome c oxidase subunit II [Planctomyces sp. SH-PL14]|uniref:cytochrome c oxidase subunit II n=1 Tax=Planctomyces sp. SH-PL14 TaxID=1632864 RepID=UPI00078D7FAB|nr:cytochrome c oxidase subunit II [Planctomyces sp. SH-PL14]AMV20112.1 Cytochrome c oxidase subunit 2 precursor [Planctomyces sp. SH-PL14]